MNKEYVLMKPSDVGGPWIPVKVESIIDELSAMQFEDDESGCLELRPCFLSNADIAGLPEFMGW